mgnify:CR=1 FL=1
MGVLVYVYVKKVEVREIANTMNLSEPSMIIPHMWYITSWNDLNLILCFFSKKKYLLLVKGQGNVHRIIYNSYLTGQFAW